MYAGLIGNVGQRDLYLDGMPLESTRPSQERNLRSAAQAILDDYDRCRDRLSAPMLEAAIEEIRASGEGKLAWVRLMATDQEARDFRHSDTVECAKVLAKFLQDGSRALIKGKVMVTCVADPPNRYDAMLDWYKRTLRSSMLEGVDRIYLLASGGTPACNMALILAGILTFGERCVVLNVGEKGQGAIRTSVVTQVLDQHRHSRFEALLARWDFEGIAADEAYEADVSKTAAAAAAWSRFDFAEAKATLNDLCEHRPGLPGELHTLARDLVPFLSANDPPRTAVLRQLYWNALIKWRRQEYADFLARVWRLIEEALYDMAEQQTGVSFRDPKKRIDESFVRWIESAPETAERLRTLSRFDDLRPTVDLLVFLARAMAESAGSSADESAALSRLAEAADTLRPWRGLRNKSIVAHGFRGLSLADLLEKSSLKEEEAMEALENLLVARGVSPGGDPYERFAVALRALKGGRRNA